MFFGVCPSDLFTFVAAYAIGSLVGSALTLWVVHDLKKIRERKKENA